jgi:hypothetical protein
MIFGTLICRFAAKYPCKMAAFTWHAHRTQEVAGSSPASSTRKALEISDSSATAATASAAFRG